MRSSTCNYSSSPALQTSVLLGTGGLQTETNQEDYAGAVNSHKLMDFAGIPITTSVSLSAPEELINPSEFSQPLQEGMLICCVIFFSLTAYLAVPPAALCALCSDVAWQQRAAGEGWLSWSEIYPKERVSRAAGFSYVFSFLKLVSVPVRDGIIDLNRIMKYYTSYSTLLFSGLQFCNVAGNEGWGCGG